jgi:hypothetical protein
MNRLPDHWDEGEPDPPPILWCASCRDCEVLADGEWCADCEKRRCFVCGATPGDLTHIGTYQCDACTAYALARAERGPC